MSPTAASDSPTHGFVAGNTKHSEIAALSSKGGMAALPLPMLTWDDAHFSSKNCMESQESDSDSGRHSDISSQSGPGSPLQSLASPFSRHSSSSSSQDQVDRHQQAFKPSSPTSFRGATKPSASDDDEITSPSRESSVDHTDYSHFFAKPEPGKVVAKPAAILQARRQALRKPSQPLCYAASPAAVILNVDWKGRAKSQHIAFRTPCPASQRATTANKNNKVKTGLGLSTEAARSPACSKPMPGLRASKQQLERKKQRKERKARLKQLALFGECADTIETTSRTPSIFKAPKKKAAARTPRKPTRRGSGASSSRSSVSPSSPASRSRPTPSSRRPSTSAPGCGVACATVVGKQCACCGNKTTPLWRDMEGKVPLCNACGIRYKKYHVVCGHCLHVPNKQESALPRCAMCNTRNSYVRRPGAQQIATLMQHSRVQTIMGDMERAAKRKRN